MSKELIGGKISPTEAAALMEKSTLFIYEGMRREVLDIGVAMKMQGSSKWSYSISPTKLAQYLGVDVETLYERLAVIRERKGVSA